MFEKYQIDSQFLLEKVQTLSSDSSPQIIEEFSKNINASSLSLEEKRDLFSTLFDKFQFIDSLDAILNLWTVAIMLEHPEPTILIKIDAARQLLKDENISDRILNEWVYYIWKESSQIPKDVMEFLTVDFRNH